LKVFGREIWTFLFHGVDFGVVGFNLEKVIGVMMDFSNL